mgnify:FL=1
MKLFIKYDGGLRPEMETEIKRVMKGQRCVGSGQLMQRPFTRDLEYVVMEKSLTRILQ